MKDEKRSPEPYATGWISLPFFILHPSSFGIVLQKQRRGDKQMGVTLTREVVRALSVSAKTIFEDGFAGANGVWSEIATVLPSEQASEDYGWLAELPQMREFGDERVIKSLSEFRYTIRNRKFEATIGVAREVIEDDRRGQVRMRVLGLIEAAQAHYDQLLFDLIRDGEVATCYDGLPFYAANHKIGGQTVGNVDDLALTADNLEAVIAGMMQIPLAGGGPMGVVPTHLLVPPALSFAARRLLASAYTPGAASAAHGAQASNPLQGLLQLVVSPRLATTTEWHVLDCGHSVRPFLVQQRIAPQFSALDGSDGENESSFLRDEYLYGVRSRDNAGYGLWMYAHKSTGAS